MPINSTKECSMKQKNTVTTKKIQLFPVGEKEERDRVYKYLRDGIYHQYCILNTYMSQVGCLYYKYDKKFTDPNFKEEMKMIFRYIINLLNLKS